MVQVKKKIWKTFEVEVPLEEGVTASINENILTVKGPKGEVSKKMKFPRVYVRIKGNNIVIGTEKFSQSEKKIIHTYRAHVKNLIKGVTEGFEYKLVVVYAKFPISIELKDGVFSVKNLLGEKVPRRVKVPNDVKIEIKGNKEIIVSGIDKERVGQVAASLEQSTRVLNMDRRVVQDGIFITHKPHRVYV